MATEEQWKILTGDGVDPTPNERHAIECRGTPLEADAILDMVAATLEYYGDGYYDVLTRPVDYRLEEYMLDRARRRLAADNPQTRRSGWQIRC